MGTTKRVNVERRFRRDPYPVGFLHSNAEPGTERDSQLVVDRADTVIVVCYP